MGFVTESKILQQDKKAQGETNVRLDALIAEQRRTNELLAHLVQLLTPRAAPAPQPYAAPQPYVASQPYAPPAGPQATSWGAPPPQ